MQGEKEEALSKRWEIEIHISYSGVSVNADPEGFNCFNLCFIPRREIRSISSGGPIDTLSIYCLSKRILDFQNIPLGEAFLKPLIDFIDFFLLQNVLLCC